MDNTIIIDKYSSIVDIICDRNNYDSNIRHLLYIILPAFILKYGIKNEKVVLDCFQNTYIYVAKGMDSSIEAFFDRKIIKILNQYVTQKYIVVNGFEKSRYIYLIDSIVHEFNHAVNSINNEILESNNEVKLRVGLSYVVYSGNVASKSDTYVLEEMINTRQSEDIVSLIYNLNYNGRLSEINNMLEVIKNEKSQDMYKSNAYEFHMTNFAKLINNKTFMKNVEVYRLNGNISEIENMFDEICGDKKYSRMNKLLYELTELLSKYEKAVLKFKIRNKILYIVNEINDIIDIFNDSCVYK